MKLAQFKSTDSSHTAYWDESMEDASGYVRVSQYVDVEFPPLKSSDVISAQLAALSIARTEAADRFSRTLKEIDNRSAELQSNCHEQVAA